MGGELVLQIIPSVHKSTKESGFSFAHYAPKAWNVLLNDIHSATSLLSFRKKLKAFLFTNVYPL